MSRRVDLDALEKLRPSESWAVSDQRYVVNPEGDAELGNWLVARCPWPEIAAYIVTAHNELLALIAELRELRSSTAPEQVAEAILKWEDIVRAYEAEQWQAAIALVKEHHELEKERYEKELHELRELVPLLSSTLAEQLRFYFDGPCQLGVKERCGCGECRTKRAKEALAAARKWEEEHV